MIMEEVKSLEDTLSAIISIPELYTKLFDTCLENPKGDIEGILEYVNNYETLLVRSENTLRASDMRIIELNLKRASHFSGDSSDDYI